MAAASAASLCAKFSSLSVNSHRRKPFLFSSQHLPLTTSKISLSKPPQKLPPPKANSSGIDFDDTDPEEIPTFSPPEPPEGFVEPPSFDDEPPESEEEIARAYEELYGPAYSGESYLGNDVYVMDAKLKKSGGLAADFKIEKIRDGFEEVVVQVRRVTKVVKGGRQMNFRAVVVVGDKKGNVGVGVGKAKEVVDAVRKASLDARREIVTIPMNKYKTFPFKVEGDYGAATVMLRPSSVGSGVVAGGVVKTILEMSGLGSGRGKQIGGSKNILNNARATLVAAQKLRLLNDVAEERGIPLEELLK